MSAPPGYVALPDDRPPVSGGDAHLGLLIRKAREADPALREVSKRDLMRMAREFAVAEELDARDRQARQASAEEFGAWARRRGDLIQVRGRPRQPWAVTSR